MHTVSHRSLSVMLFSAGILAALLLVPTASPGQIGNTVTGTAALFSNTTGDYNTADGYYSLFSNTTGNYNTAEGYYSLFSNTTGDYNTANGDNTLYNNTTGSFNIANGFYALYANTTGSFNIANGYSALYKNTTGQNNIANGYQALYSNTTGQDNTANGVDALYYNTTGNNNTADGYFTLTSNTTGTYNTANGYGALHSNTTGNSNTANGDNALYYNTGQYNTGNGVGALYYNTTGNNNTADGYFALLNSTTGSYNIALGNSAGDNITTGSNNIDIGNQGVAGDAGIIRIGSAGTHLSTYIAGISGVGVTGGAVYVTANGQLGILKSSARFKYDIQNMGAKSDKLMDLRPVMFRYKEASEDGTHPLQYGLIAEEVAKVYPDLVQYDKQGKPFTVYYHLLTPMMLNELQRANQEINSLKTTVQSQSAVSQTQNSALQNQLQTQSAAVTSLRHTVQLLLIAMGALVLVALIGTAYVLAGRTRRLPSWRVHPIEKCVS